MKKENYLRVKKQNNLFSYYGFTEKDTKKYPVISRILKQLTPERIKREIGVVQKVKLPSELQRWVKEYKKVGERDEFIWKWIYRGDKIIIESFNILEKYHRPIIETIFLFEMFTNLIDDISEKHKGDESLLSELLKIPLDRSSINFNQLDRGEKEYLSFTTKVWYKIETTLRRYPYYREIKPFLTYDIYQLLNTTRYSFLIYSNPNFVNKLEYWIYLSQNMQIVFVFDLCLMCSKFNTKDIGKIREIILYIQQMLRIGNDIGTWEREMIKEDFANGICVYAIDSGILSEEELKKNKIKIIKKIKYAKIERAILIEWEDVYQRLKHFGKENNVINAKKLLFATEKILFDYLVSKGHV